MPVTIDDISRHLGLSVSTVSKVLNGYSDVSEKTRERVLAVARELEYHPSAAARNLRRQRTNKIGFLLPGWLPYTSEYTGELIIGATLVAEKADYNVILYTSMANEHEKLVRICRAREVDGLLLRGSGNIEATITLLKRENIPFVLVGRAVDHPDVSYVAPDNLGGSITLMRHLIALGHRRIGFTARPELHETHRDRMLGYRQSLEEAGIAYDESLVVWTKIEPRSGYLAMEQLLDLPNPPTALYAIHDLIAIDALQAAKDRGLRVPDDIAIATFDGLPSTLLTSPPLTAVHQPVRDVGQQAVEMLLAHIADPGQSAVHHILPVHLSPRQSTLGDSLRS